MTTKRMKLMSREKRYDGNRVTVKDNENITQALRRFKRKIEDSGLLDTLRKNCLLYTSDAADEMD
jgi:predicted ATP-grasp superfamily ATP-dependent carboligase